MTAAENPVRRHSDCYKKIPGRSVRKHPGTSAYNALLLIFQADHSSP
ncbi:hypothetical protein HMPREF1508_0580 [Shuttleworthella sp. MSX8B]|uniref:Uncharacterized protein n=1 Tax=Shuttleworthella satelles DSM 14600 TaxID=626523 RepID=C4GCZ1_9FIRM|nr:hypothetical protein GCWU000342_01835 [Shuttleworthia satelles DSM 14600]EUB17041.1 hypothetical protein HMPREF1508_0580 [Shuttleworthia sp. MSX8B]